MRTHVADVGAYCVAFELHCCVAGDVSALCARDWQAESGVACAWLDKGGGLQAARETRRCASCVCVYMFFGDLYAYGNVKNRAKT